MLCTLRRTSPALVHHLAGPRRIVCTAALCWSSSDGRLPRDYESNTVLLCLVRSKRYSSLKFCIWPVLLYSVIIEDYIYVRVLAGLNTGCNNNIIKTYFRGLELHVHVGLHCPASRCADPWAAPEAARPVYAVHSRRTGRGCCLPIIWKALGVVAAALVFRLAC